MFATDKFFVGARHRQSFGISNYLTDAVPLLICHFFQIDIRQRGYFCLVLTLLQ